MLVYTYLNFNIFLNLYILETHSNKYICQIKKNTHTHQIDVLVIYVRKWGWFSSIKMSELVQHCKDLLKQENKLLICGHDIATFLSGQEVCYI